MANDSEDWREVPQLRSLRRLVSALTGVLIVGMIVVAGALIWRITSEVPATRVTADSITLPVGEDVVAAGATADGLALVTRDAAGVERVRVFDPETGDQKGDVTIRRE